jgi:hypothetical protein
MRRPVRVERVITTMPSIVCSIAALAVACIYCTYRNYLGIQSRRDHALRERVAYMLWVMANQVR